jgi:hypothetical protein
MGAKLESFTNYVNKTIAHIKDQTQIFTDVRLIAIEFGKIKAAWIESVCPLHKETNLLECSGMLHQDLSLFKNVPGAYNGP